MTYNLDDIPMPDGRTTDDWLHEPPPKGPDTPLNLLDLSGPESDDATIDAQDLLSTG